MIPHGMWSDAELAYWDDGSYTYIVGNYWNVEESLISAYEEETGNTYNENDEADFEDWLKDNEMLIMEFITCDYERC